MTTDEIKKALECCINPKLTCCNDCPYNINGKISCLESEMLKDALNLINEQENEIKQLKAQQDRLDEEAYKEAEDSIRAEIANGGTSCHWCEDIIRKKTVKEILQKVKEKALSHCRTINCYELKFIEETIDDIEGV